MNRHPGAGIAVLLAPGADALKTAELVKAEIARVAKTYPKNVKIAYASDSTDFIKLSIEEVVKTLAEAVILVVIVMFVFLQSWRATLVPAIAVPVVLLGTFGVFYLVGFSINTLTLFGLALAIGLLVDDAIVVVENVERLLEENPDMTPHDATVQSMEEISTALIAIALVLSAVFLPMAFFGGSTGVIYRQFSVTIVSAMVLSVLVALILSPALTANLLKQRKEEGALEDSWLARRFPGAGRTLARARDGFNDRFERLTNWYVENIKTVVSRKWLFLAIYGGVVLILVLLFVRLPTGFLPTEDQGGATDAVPVAGRRDAGPHGRGPARDRGLFRELRGQERQDDVLGRGRRRWRRCVGAEHRPRLHRASPTGRIARARRMPRTRSRSVLPVPSAGSATRRCSRWFRRRSAGWGNRTASPSNCRIPAA